MNLFGNPTVPVSEPTLIRRINRALARNYRNGNDCECKNLRVCRKDSRWFQHLGRYYMVDLATNDFCGPHVADIEDLAREMGLLQKGEVMGR